MNRRALWPAALSALIVTVGACTTPSLESLGPRKCDFATEHGCIDPYQCIDGGCVLPSGGECRSGAREACGKDAGECVPGTRVCAESKWSTCVGDTPPSTEVCDGLDNDCDGVNDNACVDAGL